MECSGAVSATNPTHPEGPGLGCVEPEIGPFWTATWYIGPGPFGFSGCSDGAHDWVCTAQPCPNPPGLAEAQPLRLALDDLAYFGSDKGTVGLDAVWARRRSLSLVIWRYSQSDSPLPRHF